jgi:hypothetical protein
MNKFTLFFFLLSISLQSQEFSVLTCDRGDEIYSTFGHSAIRYVDTMQGIDWVYNYGLFEFSDPNFIPKFCMGKLDYMVGKENMGDFMAQYVYQRRRVNEQVLNLSTSQKDSLYRFLEWNILDANKYYRYDFLFNNCATKIIDVIKQNCPGVQFEFYKDAQRKSFRDLIHINAANTVPWIDWLMDIGIGSPTDRKATDKEYTFLPFYVAKALSLSKNGGQPLIATEILLNPGEERASASPFYLMPYFFGILLIILSVYHKIFNKTWTRIAMGSLFILLGIGGLVLGFEWFFTEHSVTKNNWNIGWLNPISLIFGIAFLINRQGIWLSRIIFLGLMAAVFGWIFQLQGFHVLSLAIILSALIQTNLKIKFKLNK